MEINVFIFIMLFGGLCCFSIIFLNPNREHVLHPSLRIIIPFLIFFIIFYTFRDFSNVMSNDTKNYLNVFNRIILLDDIPEMRYEMGFSYLMFVISKIGNDRFFFFVVGSFIYLSFLLFILKNLQRIAYVNYIFPIIVFVLYGTFFHSTNLMRQYIAISIVLYSYSYLYIRSYKKFYAIVLIASLFHTSSLVCCLLPIINNIKINKRTIYIFISIVLVFILLGRVMPTILLQNLFIFDRYEYMLNDERFYSGESIKVGAIMIFIISLYILFYLYQNLIIKNEHNIFLIKIYAIGIIFLSLSPAFTQFERISAFFTPTMFPLFGMVKRNFIMYFLIVVLLIFCCIVNTFRTNWTGFFPYYFM